MNDEDEARIRNAVYFATSDAIRDAIGGDLRKAIAEGIERGLWRVALPLFLGLVVALFITALVKYGSVILALFRSVQ